MHALAHADSVSPETRKVVRSVVEKCNTCKKFNRSQPRPRTALPKVTETNQIITWDLKELKNGKHILWMVDSFSRYLRGSVIGNKRKETVLKALYYKWICTMGFPSVGFWTDNGGKFQNNEMSEFVEKVQLKLRFGPAHSPWANGTNERNHGIADNIMEKTEGRR